MIFVEEATASFRKAFPELVRFNDEPIFSAFYRMARIFITQRGIENDTRVFTYTDKTSEKKQKSL